MSRRSFYRWLGLTEQRWTKGPNEEVRPAKTAWDWLQLLIVPALMHLIGPANWWLPRRLDRALPHLSVEPPEPQATTA